MDLMLGDSFCCELCRNDEQLLRNTRFDGGVMKNIQFVTDDYKDGRKKC